MTDRERVVVSAYTGFLMCDFDDVQQYIQEKLGRPVWTHELADEAIQNEIQEKTRPDFLALCQTEEGS